MSVPHLDDRHPIERERIAQLNDLIRSVGRTSQIRDLLAAGGIADPACQAALEHVVAATLHSALRRLEAGTDLPSAVGTAIIGCLLFGIRLAKKDLV